MKAITKTGQRVRVGIDDGDEATVGMAHEFGTSTIPQRSFLRMPLTMFLEKRLAARSDFNDDAMKEVIKTQKFGPWLKKIAQTSLEVIDESFSTGGWGSWVPDKPSDHKKTDQILVETGKLRGSIKTEIVE